MTGEDELARVERLLRVRTRQLAQAHELWCGAAEQALAGNPQSLRLRVDLHRAPPVEVALSSSGDER